MGKFFNSTNDENDGKIILHFSKDNMEVRGDFHPFIIDGQAIEDDYIRNLLDEHRIIYGIKWDEIEYASRRCFDEHIPVMDVLIAQGNYPEEEIPEYLRMNPNLGREKKPQKDKGAVDHRSRSPFVIVKKGQAVAVVKQKKTGVNGINVLGEEVKFTTSKIDGVQAGENTVMDGKFLRAAIDGQLVQIKGILSVRDYLQVKGPVGYRTGNIIFPGNVLLDGPVADGFKIYSGGSIVIKQTFDVTDAVSKKDLTVNGGIIGRGKAIVKVGGSLHTKFIENCQIACRKKVAVELDIINSKIYTIETLETGEKGRIVGSEVYALKGLTAGGLGKKTGRATLIHCGVDFLKERERERYNGILRMLSIKIKHLRDLLETPEVNKEGLESALSEMEAEKQKTQKIVTEMLSNMNSYEDAVVEVKGETAPGTLIEICHTALFVTEPLRKTRFRLDKINNKIITENL